MDSILTKDFAELSYDMKFIDMLNKFEEKLSKVDQVVTTAVEFKDIEKISKKERVKIDHMLVYALNSLFWMLLKVRGSKVLEQDIKHELARVRATMLREFRIDEFNTIRPVLDKGAAGRFIKHGLHIRFDKDDETTEGQNKQEDISSETSAQQMS